MSLSLLLVLLACLASAFGHCQELCDHDGNGHFKGILAEGDPENHLLALKGENYWRLGGNLKDGFSLERGYPRKIAAHWVGFPANTSVEGAVYDLETGVSYLVQGEQSWAFKHLVLQPGYPKVVDEDPFFESDEEDDTEDEKRLTELAEHSHAFGIFPFAAEHMYFFNGTQYSKYRLPGGPIEDGYPKPVVPFWFQCPKTDSSEELL